MNAITDPTEPIDPRLIIAAILEEVDIEKLNVGDETQYKTDTINIAEDFNFVHLIPYLDRYDVERDEEFWIHVQIEDSDTLNIIRLDEEGNQW